MYLPTCARVVEELEDEVAEDARVARRAPVGAAVVLSVMDGLNVKLIN